MDSRNFIKQAALIIKDIGDQSILENLDLGSNSQETRQRIQRDLNQLFSGLQNPTLPSAYRLRDAALKAGYQVDPRVVQRLRDFENLS